MSRKVIGKKYEEGKRYIAYDYNMARDVDDEDFAYAIYDTQENDFYFDDKGNNPVFDTEEDAEKYIQDNKLNEDRELLVEDELGEDFYEKICRAYISTQRLEWVTTNPENNNSVVHGYFVDDTVSDEWGEGDKITPENFKDACYDGYTEEEIESGDVDVYEYDTWEDFYDEYIEDEIKADIQDVGTYDYSDNWDFYVSQEDLNKLGIAFDIIEGSKKIETEAVDNPDTLDVLHKMTKLYYKDLDDLCKRLQDDYNGDKEFVQHEEDRLALIAILDATDGIDVNTTDTQDTLYKTIKLYYKDLDNLCKRLQDDYNGDNGFEQYEEDRLALVAILDIIESLD